MDGFHYKIICKNELEIMGKRIMHMGIYESYLNHIMFHITAFYENAGGGGGGCFFRRNQSPSITIHQKYVFDQISGKQILGYL